MSSLGLHAGADMQVDLNWSCKLQSHGRHTLLCLA